MSYSRYSRKGGKIHTPFANTLRDFNRTRAKRSSDMGPELIHDRHVELAASAEHVGSAWLMAAVVVILLMTVVAPFLGP